MVLEIANHKPCVGPPESEVCKPNGLTASFFMASELRVFFAFLIKTKQNKKNVRPYVACEA